MRIVLVEGAKSKLSSHLGDSCAVIVCAEDADETMSLLRHDSYDLILLDMSVTATDGFDLIRRVRLSRNDTPILAVTGIKTGDRVKALDLGADDAVAETVGADELFSRITAITRRYRGFSQSLLQVGDLSLCLITREVRFRGIPVALTGKEFSVLELMVLRRGTVITKTTFLTHLYDDRDEPEIKIIDVFMCKLRKKLERAGAGDIIGTVWGQGYILRDAALRRPLMPDSDIRLANPLVA